MNGGAPWRVLCHCLSSNPMARSKAAASLEDNTVRAAVIEVAKRESLFHALHDIASEYPAAFERQDRIDLALAHESRRRTNRRIRDRTLELAAEAARQSIELVALKGAMWVIEDGAGFAPWRRMVDIDVIVQAHRYEPMRSVLSGLGYRPVKEDTGRPGRDDLHCDHHMKPHRRPGEPFSIEVHRHVDWRMDLLPASMFFEGRRPIAPGLSLPSPSMAALYSIVHWQVHHFGRQRGLYKLSHGFDLARFLSRNDVDWRWVAKQAEASGVKREFDAAVATVAECFDLDLPAAIVLPPAARIDAMAAIGMRDSRLEARGGLMHCRTKQLWDAYPSAYRLRVQGHRPTRVKLGVWLARLRASRRLLHFSLSYAGCAALIFGRRCMVRTREPAR